MSEGHMSVYKPITHLHSHTKSNCHPPGEIQRMPKHAFRDEAHDKPVRDASAVNGIEHSGLHKRES
jgi:hypothetical protein